mmetsp:Transcript_30397/g.77568  ORF Transcript_30397/g.77568 Transcript_30397/m.77568 type:complete len:269 (+) Transcript_30397:980-1786(+)
MTTQHKPAPTHTQSLIQSHSDMKLTYGLPPRSTASGDTCCRAGTHPRAAPTNSVQLCEIYCLRCVCRRCLHHCHAALVWAPAAACVAGRHRLVQRVVRVERAPLRGRVQRRLVRLDRLQVHQRVLARWPGVLALLHAPALAHQRAARLRQLRRLLHARLRRVRGQPLARLHQLGRLLRHHVLVVAHVVKCGVAVARRQPLPLAALAPPLLPDLLHGLKVAAVALLLLGADGLALLALRLQPAMLPCVHEAALILKHWSLVQVGERGDG